MKLTSVPVGFRCILSTSRAECLSIPGKTVGLIGPFGLRPLIFRYGLFLGLYFASYPKFLNVFLQRQSLFRVCSCPQITITVKYLAAWIVELNQGSPAYEMGTSLLVGKKQKV